MIGYSYWLVNNPEKELFVNFKFDVLSEGAHRKIWVYREDLAVNSLNPYLSNLLFH